MVSEEPIGKIVEIIYPNLNLVCNRTNQQKSKEKFTTLGSLLISVHNEVNSLTSISLKTGTKLPRLKDLIKKESAVILAYELYLIELATEAKVGSYFEKLFSGLQLNSSKMQEKLKVEERNK